MGKGGPLAFLAKKPWHPLNARNQEEIWKREQAHLKEIEKVEELKRKVEEERHQEQFDSFVADATKQTKQERVEWMYQGSLAAQEASEKRKEEYLLGKAVDVLPESKEEPQSRVDAVAQGPSTSAPDFNANETWSRLNADPMLLMKRLEVDKVKQVTSNPYLVAQLKEQLRAARGKSEKKKKSSKHKSGKKDKKEKREKHEKREKSARKRSSSSSPEPEDEPRAKRRRSGHGSPGAYEAGDRARADTDRAPYREAGRRDDRAPSGSRGVEGRQRLHADRRDRDADRTREAAAARHDPDRHEREDDRGTRRVGDDLLRSAGIDRAERSHRRERSAELLDGSAERVHDRHRGAPRERDTRHEYEGDRERHRGAPDSRSPDRRRDRDHDRGREGGADRVPGDEGRSVLDRADRNERSRDRRHEREPDGRRASDDPGSSSRGGGRNGRNGADGRNDAPPGKDSRTRAADYGLQDAHVPEYAAGRESQAELTRRAHEERIQARQREEAEVAERAAAARRGYKAGRMTEAEKEARRRDMLENASELDTHRTGRMRAAHTADRGEELERGADRDTDDFVSSTQAQMLSTEAGTLEGQVRRSRGKLALH